MTVDVAPWLTDSRWPTVPIRYVARLGTGHTPSRQNPEYWENCTVPWVTLADVKQLRDGRMQIISQTEEKISPLGIANSSAVRHPAGTVILSRTASVGFSAILGADMATSQDFATWTCSEKIDPKFLLHSLRAMAPDLRRVAMGSTHKTVYMPEIANLRVALPPLEEQRRIAEFLDAETERIDVLNSYDAEVLARIRERESSFLEELLVSQVADARPLSTLTNQKRQIMYGIVLPGPNVADGVPIVKGGDVAANRLSPDRLSRTTREIEARYARSRLSGGDLVIAIRGSVGEVARVPDSLSGANLTQDAARISIGEGVHAGWLEMVLNTPFVQNQLRAKTTGATIKGINIGDLKKVVIPTPSGDEQRRLYKAAEKVVKVHEDLSLKVVRQQLLLAERRQALITAAVTGQLDVTTGRRANLP